MSVLKPLARLYNQLNPATLSGAIDIVIVKQPDGSFSCSPFHVRFGKFQVPYASLSTPDVEIKINEKLCRSLKMIVGENGEALFCCNDNQAEDEDDDLLYQEDTTEDEEELGSQSDDIVSEFEEMEELAVAEADSEVDNVQEEEYSPNNERDLIPSDQREPPSTQTPRPQQIQHKNIPTQVPDADGFLPNRKRKRRKKRSLSVIRVTDDSFHPDFTKRSNSHTSSSVLSTVTNTSTTTSVPFIKTPSYNQSTSTTTDVIGSSQLSSLTSNALNKNQDSVFEMELDNEPSPSSCATPTQQAVAPTFPIVDSVQIDQIREFSSEKGIFTTSRRQSLAKLITPAMMQHKIDPTRQHCNSDCEPSVPCSPLSTSPLTLTHARLLERPDSPKSDSEIGTSTSNVIENVSWLWGEHLEPYQPLNPPSPGGASNRVGLPTEEKANNQRVRSLSPPSAQERAKRGDVSHKGGIYLENLASVDQSTKQLYLYPKNSQTNQQITAPANSSHPHHPRTPPRKTRHQSHASSSAGIGMVSPFGSHSPCGGDLNQASSSSSVVFQESVSSFHSKQFLLLQPSYFMDESTSEVGSSMPQSPGMSMEDISTQTHIGSDGEVLHCNIELSLCGGLKSSESVISQTTFDQYLVTYEEFQNDPYGILSNPNLVVKMNGSYFKWQVAAPLIISHVVFQRSLDDPAKGKLLKNFMASSSRAGWGWFSRSKPANGGSTTNLAPTSPAPKVTNDQESLSVENTTMTSYETAMNASNTHEKVDTGTLTASVNQDSLIDKSTLREETTTNRLTSAQIARLNLKMGSNEITFRITSQFFGSTTLQANIFVFNHNEKIIISDVDGTVTKSDVMGQILPPLGVTDWSQQHIVDLYQKIADNGYKFLYLSARAISMASMTKTYLRKVRQNEKLLPDGPLLLSPASLVSAFHQEVILKKPEEFKIRCLSDIKHLFPNGDQENPFYAGFGNKSTDSVSYTNVGIPPSKIFIINPKGDVKIENAFSIQTSYFDLCGKVDHLFPALNSTNKLDNLDYTAFHFWRDLPPIDYSSLSLEASVNELTVSTSSSTTEKSSKK